MIRGSAHARAALHAARLPRREAAVVGDPPGACLVAPRASVAAANPAALPHTGHGPRGGLARVGRGVWASCVRVQAEGVR